MPRPSTPPLASPGSPSAPGCARRSGRSGPARAPGEGSPGPFFGRVGPGPDRRARSGLRGLLGVNEIEERIAGLSGRDSSRTDPDSPLRARGAELLRRSSEVDPEDPTHPAYARILGELAPDEARILRLMEESGPQATVDVRTWRPLDVGSRVVAPGLSMIGRQPGSATRARSRLPQQPQPAGPGLVLTRAGRLRSAYQVLEAQPDVIDAIKEAGRARVVHRSIALTPFGRDFCEMALPQGEGPTTAEFEALAAGDRRLGATGRPARPGRRTAGTRSCTPRATTRVAAAAMSSIEFVSPGPWRRSAERLRFQAWRVGPSVRVDPVAQPREPDRQRARRSRRCPAAPPQGRRTRARSRPAAESRSRSRRRGRRRRRRSPRRRRR